MSEAPEIVNLPSLVEPKLNGTKLISYTSRYLTKPGDNYGSLMISITATVQKPDGNIEEWPLVAKLPPLTNDMYWDIFQPDRTCVTENTVYEYLAPAMIQIQKDAGLKENQIYNAFPRYYGSRISLDPLSKKVDRDAVLVQENIQKRGFKAGDRHKMFDFEHTKLVLEHMAKYHALPIALRLKNSEYFDKYIRPYTHKFNISADENARNELFNSIFAELQIATNNNGKIVERVKELFAEYVKFLDGADVQDGLFTTIAHFDFWINNMMILYDDNNKPVKVKIIDFQIAQYESLAHDFVFFLLSSVDDDVLDKHYEEFFKIYYDTFINCLRNVKVDTKDYTYDKFCAEVRRVYPYELSHALIMVTFILADNSTLPEDFKDVDITLMGKNSGLPQITKKINRLLEWGNKHNVL